MPNSNHELNNANIVLANYFQFSAAEKISFPFVYSRMLIWVQAGSGIIKINGNNYDFFPDDFYIVPWKHSISYKPDKKDPFLTGTIHIIPFHDLHMDDNFDNPLNSHGLMEKNPTREDRIIPQLDSLKAGSFKQFRNLKLLGEYCIGNFQMAEGRVGNQHELASLLIQELVQCVSHSGESTSLWPLELKRMVQYIDNHKAEQLSLKELVTFSSLSSSTVMRMFKQFTGKSPVKYIISDKLDYACKLLSTSRLNVSEIGNKVGMNDPYYFSKLFKKERGSTPLAYRRQKILF